ncbi:hypothetical protein RJ640_026255 [Escallonia rubra]|uniref:DUF7804 domain-containing protein n=1 Tax=Escallonia rubra TaxID=112253 RepID=A0AA88UP25_9ASTE|nr:hypothetical protein RJ640_026255 [Escallonia rubra]
MAACSGIRSVVNLGLTFNSCPALPTKRSNPIFESDRSLSIPNRGIRNPPRKICASATLPNPPVSSRFNGNVERCNRILNEEFDNKGQNHNLESWMRDSAVEIVKNLKQAPLLVQVYAQEECSTKLQTEKADPERWSDLKREWKEGERPSPDGVILVEELKGKRDLDSENEINGEEEGDETKAWGVVVQGKGEGKECRSAFYLMKTSRVEAGEVLEFSGVLGVIRLLQHVTMRWCLNSISGRSGTTARVEKEVKTPLDEP